VTACDGLTSAFFSRFRGVTPESVERRGQPFAQPIGRVRHPHVDGEVGETWRGVDVTVVAQI